MPFHFAVDRQKFLKAISGQQNITSKKGTLAILANILLNVEPDHIVITGTDLDIGLRQVIPAEVHETGILTLPAKKLYEVARESASPEITFREMENNWVEISSGSSLYRMAGMISDEFPEFPQYDEGKMVEIDSEILIELVDKTSFSIALDKENMYALTAALLEKEEEDGTVYLKMITSDGHRLTIMRKEAGENGADLELNPETLIPRRGILEIRKFCEESPVVQLGIEEKQAVLKNENGLLIIRLIEGDFPDYRNILNIISNDNIIIVNRLRFLEGLKRINLFTDEMFHAIQMKVKDNLFLLSSQNADYGSAKDEFEVEYSGDPLSLAFNCRYFIEALQVMDGDVIQAGISSDDSPCVITSESDEGFLSIIMPMKL